MIFRKVVLATLFLSFFSAAPQAAKQENIENLASEYNKVKKKAVELDKARRRVLASMYDVNKRIKKISEKKEELTKKVLSARANSKDLAKEVVRLEKLISKQKLQLGKRIKVLYHMTGKNSMRLLFNSVNSHDFDRNLRFLRMVSEHQYKFIKQYEENIKVLKKQKDKFRAKVKELAALQKKLKRQEKMLVADEDKKRSLLKKFRED